MTPVAARLARLASSDSWLESLAVARGFGVRLPDGRELGATSGALPGGAAPSSGPPRGGAAPAFVVTVYSQRTLRTLRVNPSPLRLGRAWIDGDLDIDGDIFAAMETLHDLEAQLPGPWMRVVGWLRSATRPWRDAQRDIAAHYDLPSAFYELFLDRRMVYTCAYYRDADTDLDHAQQEKLDLVCRKLRLAGNESFLDLGCGWGALSCWAAANYGVHAHGVTLSREQATWAAAAVARAGLQDRVTIEHLDYRSIPAGRRYDKIAAVGMIEHLGRARHGEYFGRVRDLLTDDGLFLNHGITMRAGASWSSEMEFLHRYVFPGLDLVDVPTTLAGMERSGLEVIDVENLRPHYARTTREWATRLWTQRERACAIAGERVWRTWVAYLAAASVAFRSGWIGLHQVVARRGPSPDDGMRPRLREDVYGAIDQLPLRHHSNASPTSTTAINK